MNSVTLIGIVEPSARARSFLLSIGDVLIPMEWRAAAEHAAGERLAVEGSLYARYDGSVAVGAAAVHRLPSTI